MQDVNLKRRGLILTKDKGNVNSVSMRRDSNAETPQSLAQSKAEKRISNSYQ